MQITSEVQPHVYLFSPGLIAHSIPVSAGHVVLVYVVLVFNEAGVRGSIESRWDIHKNGVARGVCHDPAIIWLCQDTGKLPDACGAIEPA